MRKYEEERYRFENIKEQIYPWVADIFPITNTINGKKLTEKEVPMIAFIGDLKVLFVIKRGEESFEVITEKMLPPETDIARLYQIACQNLVRDVEFVISNTMYGAFSIFADGLHEASALCFKHIWTVCVDKLKDDLLIMVPARDMLVFAEASNEKAVQGMKTFAQQYYERSTDRISDDIFVFTQNEKELLAYDETKH